MLAQLSWHQVKDYDVHVAVLKDIDTLKDQFAPDTIFHFFGPQWVWHQQLKDLYSTLQPFCIHTHLGHADLYGLRAAQGFSFGRVCSMHNEGFSHGWKDRIYQPLYRYALRRWAPKALVVANSKSVQQHVVNVLGVAEKRTCMIYNPLGQLDPNAKAPVDSEVLAPAKLGQKTIIFVGRLEREKGLDILLKALAIILENQRPRLLVLGIGTLEAAYKAMAKSLGLEEHIVWLGYCQNVYHYIGLADALVAPSRTEAFGNAVLEAFQMGKPAIAANTGGLRELVNDGQTGLHFRPEDSLDLSDKIIALMSSEDQRLLMGENAKLVASGWPNLASYAHSLSEVYSAAVTIT